MIRNSFSIFPGIGPRIEKYLWKKGVLSWDDFLKAERVPAFSAARKQALDGHITLADAALGAEDYNYLAGLLGPSGAWRLWGMLSPDALYMDIETDGRRADEGVLTVVGFYSHGEYRPYVCGKDLTCEAVRRELADARLLVTFSGSTFDIPYLKNFYPGLEINVPHFDLCPAGHKIGLKGGLKKVEKIIGIQRADELEGITGYEAVLLWHAHLGGARGAIDTLVEYNREDTVNLHRLAGRIYELLLQDSGHPGLAARQGTEAAPTAYSY